MLQCGTSVSRRKRLDRTRGPGLTLFPRSQVLNGAVERVQGPHHEAGQSESERKDEKEDPSAALFDEEQNDPDRIEHAKDKVDQSQYADPGHDWANRGPNNPISHPAKG